MISSHCAENCLVNNSNFDSNIPKRDSRIFSLCARLFQELHSLSSLCGKSSMSLKGLPGNFCHQEHQWTPQLMTCWQNWCLAERMKYREEPQLLQLPFPGHPERSIHNPRRHYEATVSHD